ncbi:NAD-dependent epimerase/dehydratase family protein [Sphaerisporangium sp. NPDC051011]|uniref:NAD-dependent epimerase/dehydratase family protein n=1 Tax=Sphaerisporangium sp. NPDC051011 TaxID=3155792 RepID=UPI0033FE0043
MIENLNDLREALSAPSEAVADGLARTEGDLMLLGAGGKIGPDLAVMARRALDARGSTARVIAVARTLSEEDEAFMKQAGVEIFRADLLDDADLARLPEAGRVVYLAGRKFGTHGFEHGTWALNTYLPGRVMRCFPRSRVVAFSTGNVYPLVPVISGGADESTPTSPVGEYAQSCLGRERIIEHFSRAQGTPAAIVRLNYAVEMRYGVLLELARAVHQGEPIDLATGSVNVIWQGDVNAMTLRLFEHCATPPLILNMAGPETASVRWLAGQLAARLGVTPRFTGGEEPAALLSNAARSHALFGYPTVPLMRLLDATARWVAAGGAVHGKATHFQEREGRF